MKTNKFNVTLWPFGANGKIVRTVTLDADVETDEQSVGYIFGALNDIFRLGQNDFQPMQIRSVSVGDVIEFGDDGYIVCNVGFRRVPKNYIPTQREIFGIVNQV